MEKSMDDLKASYLSAKTEQEREKIFDLIRAKMDADPAGVGAEAIAQITRTNEQAKQLLVKDQIKDILPVVSLSYIAREYFGKTKEWLYQRINGNQVNGRAAQFTPDEVQTLNTAFKDIAQKLSKINVS